MKIKELHIRNIASIEEADIDFSKDLVDAVTGDPASIFLISGDTGVGKSIILDGIAMALYGTTPRLESVENPKKNKFVDNRGEEVMVSSIEQYSRLGISEKDPCYSEVVFEGNDGKEYRSRLTLGYKLGKDNILRNSTPSLTLTVGDSQYSGKEVKSINQAAIGLSFPQFNRMVMLAQGQFAAFLTGKKDERQDILEQLTNTEHFSAYGEAIERLFKNAKDNFKTKTELRNQAAGYVLSEKVVTELEEKLKNVETEDEKNRADTAIIQEKIDAVKKIVAANDKIQESSGTRTKLEAVKGSKDYLEAQTFVNDWDGTTTERQRLKDLRDERRQLETTRKDAGKLSEQFSTLLADLAFRCEDVRSQQENLASLEAWLQEREDRKELYTHVDGTVVKLGNLGGINHAISVYQTKLQEESAKTESLKEEEANRKADLTAAQEILDAKDAEVKHLHEEQEALDPERTNDELNNILPAKASQLEKLNAVIADWDKLKKEKDDLLVTIKEDEETLDELNQKVERERNKKDSAKKSYDTAQACYDTMNMSTDDILVDLRKKLQEERQDICPLCGQKIEAFTEDYSTRVTQLDGIREAKRAEFEQVDRAWNDAKNKRDTFSGQLEQKKKNVEQLDRDVEDKVREISEAALEANLDPEQELSGQIDAAQSDLETRKSFLETRQGQSAKIGEKLNALLKERKPLEQTRDEAKDKWQKALDAVIKNKEAIEDYSQRKKDSELERNELLAELSLSMSSFYPNWTYDLKQAAATLKADAGEYGRKAQEESEAKTAVERFELEMATIHGSRDAILELFPDWKRTMAPVSRPSADIVREWTVLNSKAGSAHTALDNHERHIKEYMKVLDAWYESTGRDEAALDAIQAAESQLPAFQKLVKDTEEQYRDAVNAIAEAERDKGDAMRELGITEESEIPVLENLETESSTLKAAHDEIISRKTEITQELDNDRKNRDKLQEKQEDLKNAEALFNKWDPINRHFGGYRFRTLVQTYILRPLLNNANIYLREITDRYKLTCSEDNEQLSILVQDRYNKDQIRSATVLSGGERFMISLALSLALSSLNRPDMNVNILFIDEGFGTLDKASLESVMTTLEKLQEIAGQSNRRVGIISHREELDERIPVKIRVIKKGEGRSRVEFSQE